VPCEARGYANLVDVLRDLPGMEINEFSYAPIGTHVAMRVMLGKHKIIVLVNGMRVNPPGGDAMPFYSDFGVREVEQIEVIYGPGSTLFGQDAISAVINVKTKRAGAPWGFVVPPSTTPGDKIEWPWVLGLNIAYQIRPGLDSFLTINNLTNRKCAMLYDGVAYPAETISGILGLRFTR